MSNYEIYNLSSTLIWLTLLVLKVTGYWDISWWWVFSPFWIPVVLVTIILILGLINKRLSKKEDKLDKMLKDMKAKNK